MVRLAASGRQFDFFNRLFRLRVPARSPPTAPYRAAIRLALFPAQTGTGASSSMNQRRIRHQNPSSRSSAPAARRAPAAMKAQSQPQSTPPAQRFREAPRCRGARPWSLAFGFQSDQRDMADSRPLAQLVISVI